MGIGESMKRALRLRAQDAEQKLEEASLGGGSGFYHNYFEGWSEQKETVDGKERIRRIYTGKYYVLAEGEKAFFRHKLAYAVLSALSLAVWLVGTGLHAPSNYSVIAAAPGLISLIFWLFYLAYLVRYVTRPYRMKQWDYRCGPRRILLLGRITAGLMALNCLISAVFLAGNGSEAFRAEVTALGWKLAAFCLLGVVLLTEQRTKYTVLEDEEEDPHGWVKIV